MHDETDALHAALREADDLVAHLRQRTTQLHAALLRTSRELADAREQLNERTDDESG